MQAPHHGPRDHADQHREPADLAWHEAVAPLRDGGFVTAPSAGFYSWADKDGWVVENHGVDPDYVVPQRPDQVVEGHDPQLEKAIELYPFNPLSRKMLIVDLIQAKQYEKAEAALEQYSGIFPQDDVMRKALARARASSPQP